MIFVVIGGLGTGALLGIMALGLSLIYKTAGLANFAQGEMAMFSAFLAFETMVRNGQPYALAALAAIVAGVALGAVCERLVVRPLMSQPHLYVLIATLGVNLILNNVATMLWASSQPYKFPTPFGAGAVQIGSSRVTATTIGMILTALAVAAIFSLFYSRSPVGMKMRAVDQDRVAAQLVGIDIGRINMLVWAIAGAIGAVAGILLAGANLLDTNMMRTFFFEAYAAAILGGLNSPSGAFTGGLLLGVITNLCVAYVAPLYGTAASLAIVIAVLLARPHGLFGTRPMLRV